MPSLFMSKDKNRECGGTFMTDNKTELKKHYQKFKALIDEQSTSGWSYVCLLSALSYLIIIFWFEITIPFMGYSIEEYMGFSSSAWVVDAVMGTLNAGILLSILLMFVGILSLWQALNK